MKVIILCCTLVLLAGCATQVADLQPAPQPENIYAERNCSELEKICQDQATEMRVFAAKQDAKTTTDAAKMALNILVLPVFWGIGNDENTDQLTKAMGCHQAAANQAAKLNCPFTPKTLDEILSEYGYKSKPEEAH